MDPSQFKFQLEDGYWRLVITDVDGSPLLMLVKPFACLSDLLEALRGLEQVLRGF